jgi:DNA invertase Pin-like site-specific DNA recombinase
MAKRVGVYARVSTDKSQTVENQLGELQAVAARLDWDIVGVFTDEGISGAKGRERRPAFDRLLKGITRREANDEVHPGGTERRVPQLDPSHADFDPRSSCAR